MSLKRPEPRKTRFKYLGYRQDSPGSWFFYFKDEENIDWYQIGSEYKTKAELMGDLTRFAKDRGFSE